MYKLLIVDDNSIQVQSLLHYIDWEAYGFDKIETASTGRDGLEKYFANKPDLIITDVAMPIMDGLEMVRQIRAANGDTVVLFISCYDNFDYLQSANETEAVSYILKPINQLQLEQSVKKAVSILKQREKKKDGGIETEILRLRRENFMYHMLCVHDDSIKFIESEKNLLGFEKFSLYILAKCDIINNDTSQAYTYLSYLKKDILKNKNVVINAENEKCISVLFMSASQSEDEFVKTVKKDIEECIRAGREKFSLMVVGAMSSVGRSEYDIPVLIKEAAHSLDSMNQKGNNALITTTASTGKYNAVNIKGEIMTAIAADDDGAMRKLARSLCEASAPHSPPDIEMVYVSVWAAVQMILSEQNIHVENLLGDSMVTFYKKHRFESYEQLEHWIYNMLRALSEVVAESARSKSDDIVAKIISYINQNYSTISNIEDIASHCYISSSHVRRLFKNAMGKTIFEYLLSVRMDKAKTLLTHKNAKIYEIALAVGYESKANFTLAFKKYTGMLPSDFRNKMLSGNGEKEEK